MLFAEHKQRIPDPVEAERKKSEPEPPSESETGPAAIADAIQQPDKAGHAKNQRQEKIRRRQ